MPANYVLLEKIVVGAAGASSVTFSGIPQTGYTDLAIRGSMRDSGATNNFTVEFNGNSSSIYTQKTLWAENSSATSYSRSRVNFYYDAIDDSTHTASTFNSFEMYIPNYTSANYKSVTTESVSENLTSAKGIMNVSADLFSSTAAITSIKLTQNFAQYSTFYLYGVAKLGTTPAIVPYATGGDTIMTDGTYWYHTFVSSGTFTPAKAITCDYLVVAGGGGGSAGGGGAGGLRSTVTATGGGGSLETALSLGTSAYTVTIGAGGAGGGGNTAVGASGSNSVFSTITSTGGGGGAPFSNTLLNGVTGGSGGGAATRSGSPFTAGTGGSGTANQGRAGGDGPSANGAAAGGGGGANTAGATATTTNTGTGGNGGAGVATSISGSSVTYAGGGGGTGFTGSTRSSGGSGGGGAGGIYGTNNAVAGTANTGGGGGGNYSDSTGAAGGSGIVIVRYAV
jgi:hypothetical protein